MPRGRKQRVVSATLPPRYYFGAPAVLEAVRAGRITPTAACLWQIIQAHAWQEGYCDLTDRELAEWLGGLSERQVAKLRQMLVAVGLLDQTVNGSGNQERRLLPLPRINPNYNSGELQFTRIGPIKEEEEVNLKPGSDLNLPPPPPETPLNATRVMGPDATRVNKGGVGGINPNYNSGELEFARNTVQVYSANEAANGADEGINPNYNSGELQFARNTVQVYSADEGINPNCNSGELEFARNTVQVYSSRAAADPAVARLTGFLVKRGIFPSVAAPLAGELLGSRSLAEAQIQALATLYAVRAGRDDHGQRLPDDQIIGRWVARLRDAVEPPAWALSLAREELDGDVADEDTGEDVDEATGASPAEELPAEDATAAPDPPVADQASDTPAELWQRILAQLRLQMTRDTYTACLAATHCLGLETAADGLPCLVVQAAPAAAAWLALRLKGVIIRTATGVLGQPCTVRFVAGEKTP